VAQLFSLGHNASMNPSDYLGFGVCFSFGLWLLLLPRSVISFYTRLYGGRAKMPGTVGVRLSGAVWVAVMFGVLITFLMKR
jgi:hypothetical protein